MFPTEGTVNNVLNDFAIFIYNRMSQGELTEKRFVNKLQSLCGTTNTPYSLLQQRIDKQEIDYKKCCWGNDLIDEMKDAIIRHSI